MIFTVLSDIFDNNSDSNIKMLDEILLFTNDRHRLFLDDDDVIDKLLESDWFKTLRNSYQTEIGDFVTQSLQMNKPNSVLTISNEASNSFTLDEAFEILYQTFFILLENGENDAYFIKALIKNFKKKGKTIEKHLTEGWLQFGMGGGSTIPNVIREAKQRFEQDKAKFPKQSFQYLRFFVMIDSDKAFPSETPKQEKQDLISLFSENNIPYHVLQKREMENYMSDETISEIQDNGEYIAAYLRLTSIQKDYFDIQKGLPNKNFNDLAQGVQALYNDVSTSDKNIFRQQELEFKDNTGRKLSFKSEFPKLFLSENVTQETLLARAGSNELQEILDKITELL